MTQYNFSTLLPCYRTYDNNCKKTSCMFYSSILIVCLFLSSSTLCVILPYFLSERDNITFGMSIVDTYWLINKLKTYVFVVLHITASAITIFIIQKGTTFFKSTSIILLVLWTLCLMYFIPQNAAWNLVDYGKPYTPLTHQDNTIITFLGIGDTQVFDDFYNRDFNNKLAIANINKFASIVYPLIQQNDTLNIYSDIMGLLIPGDTTQTGEDGRAFTKIYVGDYERMYGLGDNSLLRMPAYECLGNHDFDAYNKIYPRHQIYFGEPPATIMIKRRNKHRRHVIASDSNGNYYWKWGSLTVIAITYWPNMHSTNLHMNDSFEFVSNVLSRMPPNSKYIIMTHYIPNPLGTPTDIQFPHATTLKGTECEFLLNILGNRKSDLLAIVIGHLHLRKMYDEVNSDGIRIVIPPSPANPDYDGAFVMFKYHTINETLHVVEMTSK